MLVISIVGHMLFQGCDILIPIHRNQLGGAVPLIDGYTTIAIGAISQLMGFITMVINPNVTLTAAPQVGYIYIYIQLCPLNPINFH